MSSTAQRPWNLRESYLFDRTVIAEIQRAAAEGIYDIRGFGAKRRLPHFDDLLFLGASISRYPLEGYREKCATDVVLGTRFAKKPLELKIPVTIAGMSFGALSAPAKEALGRGASEVGTSTTTGDGGMTPEERERFRQGMSERWGSGPSASESITTGCCGQAALIAAATASSRAPSGIASRNRARTFSLAS